MHGSGTLVSCIDVNGQLHQNSCYWCKSQVNLQSSPYVSGDLTKPLHVIFFTYSTVQFHTKPSIISSHQSHSLLCGVGFVEVSILHVLLCLGSNTSPYQAMITQCVLDSLGWFIQLLAQSVDSYQFVSWDSRYQSVVVLSGSHSG